MEQSQVSQAYLDSMLFSVGMKESDSYFSSPSPNAKSPSKKKSPQQYGCRDSMSQRYKLGKPGSRNYRQWQSDFQLRKSHSESESSLSETDDFDFDETYEPSFGMFAQFFVDGQVNESLDPFLFITEAEQNKMVPKDNGKKKNMKKAHLTQIEVDRSDPKSSFESMSKRTKRILLKNYDCPLLQEVDQVIYTFLLDPEAGVMDLELETSFDRLLIHSMCHYYFLNSRSYNKKGKSYRVVVAKKKDQYIFPSLPLSVYLVSHGKKLDVIVEEEINESASDESQESEQ